MILGRGCARTDDDIVAEYHHFLSSYGPLQSSAVQGQLRMAPGAMCSRLGKPIVAWTSNDVLTLWTSRQKSTQYYYGAFVAFLLFRGYLQATIPLLAVMRTNVVRMHRPALADVRQRLGDAAQHLGYANTKVGSELCLLIWLLAVSGKPLNELTRPDFESFRTAYQAWYCSAGIRHGSTSDSRVARLEHYLVHVWRIFLPATRTFRHETYFAELRAPIIRAAIQTFMAWCTGKYRASTVDSYRAGILGFFRWCQDQQPTIQSLDAVTRSVALDYAAYMRTQVDSGRWSRQYAKDLQRTVRSFFEFAIQETLDTSPQRNPFSARDLPRRDDPAPRYLTDQEVRTIVQYCCREATLKERTIVTVLLHTGIRAAELAQLKVTDIVQIQGVWKLHVHCGKGLKDRLIPLTDECHRALQAWQHAGWNPASPFLFTRYGRPYTGSGPILSVIRELGAKLGVVGLTAHRFRHTFAVTLINYGLRESALQKLMGHAKLDMTLEYGRILDRTVEAAFGQAVEAMHEGAHSWVPSFFVQEDFTRFVEADSVSWIRLPVGYCRRNPKLHCESDVKCFLCERFHVTSADLPRLQAMRERFLTLGLQLKAEVVGAKIRSVEQDESRDLIPLTAVSAAH